MIYLRAGVFAEGRSDYDFLCPLLDRLLDELAAARFPAAYEIGATIGIDTLGDQHAPRAERVASAIGANVDFCTLFVIHSDGATDPARARETCIEPGISAARAAHDDIVVVGCVPVREIEAWLLTDASAFQVPLGSSFIPQLPAAPERESDPKATLQGILRSGGWRRRNESIHALFAEHVSFATLRALPAFRAFEHELAEGITKVAMAQGLR